MQPTRPADVFISYSNCDVGEAVRVARLLERAGVSVWRDGEQILGGQYYGERIVHAIKHSRVVLLLCSPDSLASDNVHQEVKLTWDHSHRRYLPLWLVPPIEIPGRFLYNLAGCQWVQTAGRSEDEWLTDVLAGLTALGVSCQRPSDPFGPQSAPPAPSGGESAERSKVVDLWREFLTLVAPSEHRGRLRLQEEDRLRRSTFRVVLIGRRKQGKTTLANRLVGGGPLPTDAVASNSALAIVRWAASRTTRLHFARSVRLASPEGWPDELRARWPSGAGPNSIDVQPHHLAPCLLCDEESDEPFLERLEVHWPADFLRQDIELVDTPGSDRKRFAEVGADALAGADLILYAVDAGTGLLPADTHFLKREIRGRGHALFLVGGTGMDRLGRRPASSPEALRSRLAAQAEIPPGLVFLLEPQADLEPLRETILRAAAGRGDVKARLSLHLLRAELTDSLGAGRDAPLRAFADRIDHLLRDHYPIPLAEGRMS